MRGALGECSEKKIAEIEMENKDLKTIFGKIRKIPEGDRIMPFSADDFGLNAMDRRMLESNGVIIEDEGKYYMPEIFRFGLGFALERGARPKVISLRRRVNRRV